MCSFSLYSLHVVYFFVIWRRCRSPCVFQVRHRTSTRPATPRARTRLGAGRRTTVPHDGIPSSRSNLCAGFCGHNGILVGCGEQMERQPREVPSRPHPPPTRRPTSSRSQGHRVRGGAGEGSGDGAVCVGGRGDSWIQDLNFHHYE